MAGERNFLLRVCIHKKNRHLVKMLNCSAKDCLICNNKRGPTSLIRDNLNRKYRTTRDSYNTKVIGDIIYNESTHIVCVFKDFLVFGDISEYLKRFYAGYESAKRLPKVYDFYDKYSKVFPNYVAIPESDFMFKNIERKQRLIDDQQKLASDLRKKKPKAVDPLDSTNRVLTSAFMREMNRPAGKSRQKPQGDSGELQQPSMSLLQSFLRAQTRPGGKEKSLSLQQLLDRFIAKDSQSSIEVPAAIKVADRPAYRKEKKTKVGVEIRDREIVRHIVHIRARSEARPQLQLDSRLPAELVHRLADRRSSARLQSPLDRPYSRNTSQMLLNPPRSTTSAGHRATASELRPGRTVSPSGQTQVANRISATRMGSRRSSVNVNTARSPQNAVVAGVVVTGSRMLVRGDALCSRRGPRHKAEAMAHPAKEQRIKVCMVQNPGRKPFCVANVEARLGEVGCLGRGGTVMGRNGRLEVGETTKTKSSGAGKFRSEYLNELARQRNNAVPLGRAETIMSRRDTLGRELLCTRGRVTADRAARAINNAKTGPANRRSESCVKGGGGAKK